MAQTRKTSERVETIRRYEVTDAELMKLPYLETAIVPRRVTVKFVDGKWRMLTVSGVRLRKDGTPGHAVSSGDYYPSVYGEDNGLPEWAVPLTEYEEG